MCTPSQDLVEYQATRASYCVGPPIYTEVKLVTNLLIWDREVAVPSGTPQLWLRILSIRSASAVDTEWKATFGISVIKHQSIRTQLV